MKQQIIELKKKLLLVELPEGIVAPEKSDNICIIQDIICFRTSNMKPTLRSFGKLTDITESQCEEWVEWIEEPQYYRDYRKEGWQGDITAKESLFSYLESRGVVFENPLGEKPVLDKGSLWGNPEQDTQVFAALNYQIDKWEEAESKIWDINRCWIFEIL